MKKFTAVISDKHGRQKQISVWIEDYTSELLLNAGDEEFIKVYIEEEYKARNIHRKETRSHQSLESSMANGFDRADKDADTEKIIEWKEETEKLYKAMEKLLPSQKDLIERVYFKGKKMSEIAREEGVDGSSIWHRMERALNTLKKYMK